MDRQNSVAREHDYTFIDSAERVRYFAERGWLVRVESTRDFVVKSDVTFPYARPEVELFASRLGKQYQHACGEQLVVTSLTRPTSRQPRNASDRTVHPTGMALDLRYSWNRDCRRWLEGVLTSLEAQGVLEATLERNPRHYHVAIFPRQYAAYVTTVASGEAESPSKVEYRVRSGDSLWTIARTYGTTVDELKNVNGIDTNRIFVGQVLDVPQNN
jgi:nucleoid-associated protein YgaU